MHARVLGIVTGALIGMLVAAVVAVAARGETAAAEAISYHGVVTPECNAAPGSAAHEWTTGSDATGTCHIRFPADIAGASVFVFGMDDAVTPQTVHVAQREISFLTIRPGIGGGYSFLVIK